MQAAMVARGLVVQWREQWPEGPVVVAAPVAHLDVRSQVRRCRGCKRPRHET